MWEGEGGHFVPLTDDCRTIQAADTGRPIFGIGIKPDTLSMKLTPPWNVRLLNFVRGILAVSRSSRSGLGARPRQNKAHDRPAHSCGAVDAGYRRGRCELSRRYSSIRRWRRWPCSTTVSDASFCKSCWPVTSTVFSKVVKKCYYYGGPGLRYFRAIEHIVFGDSYLGYLSLVLLFPFLVYALFRRFLPVRWSLALILLFVVDPNRHPVRHQLRSIRTMGVARLCGPGRVHSVHRRCVADHRRSRVRTKKFSGRLFLALSCWRLEYS